MTGWPLFWSVVFGVAVSVFAFVAIVVAIGGYKDVKIMLDRLKSEKP